MKKIPSHCPNPDCVCNKKQRKGFYIKKGYYRTRASGYRAVPKYRCRYCGRYFSAQTFKPICFQKKPWINSRLFELFCSGNTQRRSAILLRVNRKTIVRRFCWLAELARKKHRLWILESKNSTGFCQFDEMETFEHTKLKPLSIALCVHPLDYKILDAQVASMPAKGWLTGISARKYGKREDGRDEACMSVIKTISKIAKKEIVITSDQKAVYRKYFKTLKNSKLIQHKSRKSAKLLGVIEDRLDGEEDFEAKTRKKHDPMFALNHICAKLRADVSRLIRRTWTTTKIAENLQAHLYLYIAYNNGYKLI